MLSASVSA